MRKIGKGLSRCVNHQRPFVLLLSQALTTKAFPFVSFVFVCDINISHFCFTFRSKRKSFFYFQIKKLERKYNAVHLSQRRDFEYN